MSDQTKSSCEAQTFSFETGGTGIYTHPGGIDFTGRTSYGGDSPAVTIEWTASNNTPHVEEGKPRDN